MSLKKKVLHSGGWIMASTAILALAQVGQLIALARELGPREYGVVAIITLVQAFMEMLMVSAVSNAIIQRQSATADELSSLHGLNTLIGLVMGIGLAAASPLVGFFFKNPAVVAPVALLGLAVLVTSQSHVRRACLERDMEFRSVAIVESIGGLTTVGAVIVGAFALGIPGVSVGIIVGAAARTASFWWVTRKAIRLRPRLVFSETRRFLSFGLLQFLNSFVSFVDSNTATVLIGRGLSSAELGGYNLAFSVSVNIPGKINPIITRVMFPALSKVQEDKHRFGTATLQLISLAGLVNFPFLLVLAIVAPALVPLVFGEDWNWAAGLVQILAIAGYTRALGNPMGVILMAKDRQGLGLTINVFKTIFSIAVMLGFIILWGVEGAAYALVVSGVSTIILNQFLLGHLLKMPTWQTLWAHMMPLIIGLIPAALGVGVWLASGGSMNGWISIVSVALVVVGSYGGIAWFSRVPAVRVVAGALKR